MSEPAGWFLVEDVDDVEDGKRHYLDVNCNRSAVGFSILVQLTDEEEAELHGLGRTFVSYLAAKIAYWPDRYQPRDITGPIAKKVTEAELA
jgi:hypothetical protein